MTSRLHARLSLLAEQGQVSARLAELPPSAALTRRSLLSRQKYLEGALASIEPEKRDPARARLTFAGRPVAGSHGVVADFGAMAVAKFSDAVATSAAAIHAPLAAMGPIPGRDRNQLLITGTAIGSFGFELEEAVRHELDLDEPTPVALALERTQRLLEDSAESDDENLADTAADFDPRALAKVRDFVSWLADNDAVCSLEVGEHRFKFADALHVRRSLDRLSAENIKESERRFVGHFSGVLPSRRTFEFLVDGGVLVGKVGSGISDPQQINEMLNQTISLPLLETQVGSGRPRYTLLALPTLAAPRGTTSNDGAEPTKR